MSLCDVTVSARKLLCFELKEEVVHGNPKNILYNQSMSVTKREENGFVEHSLVTTMRWEIFCSPRLKSYPFLSSPDAALGEWGTSVFVRASRHPLDCWVDTRYCVRS